MQPPPLCTDSHFVLGNTQENITSIYKKDFIQKSIQQNDDKLRKNSIYKRSTLGPQQPQKNQYNTTNNLKLVKWNNVEDVTLDEKKKNDLITHHFGLGNFEEKKGSITTNREFHNPKQICQQARQNSQFYRSRMRAHSHNFKQMNNLEMKSIYSNQFNQKQLQYTKSFKIPTQKLQNFVVFGKQQVPKQTTHQAQYQSRQYERARQKNQPRGVYLGQANNQFQTTNQQYHNPKQIHRNSLPQETLKQLKGTHFNLGTTKIPFSTQSNKYQIQGSLELRRPSLQQNRNSIAVTNKFYGTTTNNLEYPPLPYSKIVIQKKTQNNNHFQYGYQGNSYNTQFKAQYANKNQQAKFYDFSNDNIKLGIDKNNFETTHKAFLDQKDIKVALPEKIIDPQQPLTHHFNHGTAQEQKITLYQDQYRREHERRSKIFHKTNL